MSWEVVMGLEVHAELSTKTKAFCGCAASFGADANTLVCPICSGMPGALPKLNKSVVEYAVKLGLATNCEIAKRCKFDRKNYFYPDLPSAYQRTQFHAPICRNGKVEIDVNGEKKVIGITQIHMEEDTGKLTHGLDETFIDLNRCSVPLLEIVSEPDFRTAAEVIAYLEKLRETMLYLEICDCKMQEGSIRADVNLSVRKPGEPFGTRVEMKNLNSFKAITRAIEFETNRQVEILESNGELVQETRRWDDDEGISFSMRTKADAQDYRYFPEPDLLPLEISDGWIDEIRAGMPELAFEKRERYIGELGLSELEAKTLTSHKNISDLFEKVAAICKNSVESARLITGEIMNQLNRTNTLPENLKLDAAKLATAVVLMSDGKINRAAYKEVVRDIFYGNVDDVEKYVAEKGLLMQNDDGAVEVAVDAVLAANPDAITDFRAGKDRAFGFLMGQVMKQLKGAGNPETVKKILGDKLS